MANMTSTSPPATPAGWYPDPADAATWRWWDGARWTDARRPRTALPPPPPAGATQRPAPPPAAAPAASPATAARAAAGRSVLVAVLAAFVLAVGLAWWASRSDSSSGGGDGAVRAGAETIARACEEFAGSYGYGPAVDDVHAGGAVAQFVGDWPLNPYTGAPMTQSDQPGDFHFSTATRMPSGEYLGYVTAVLGDGTTYAVEFEY